MPFLNIAGVDYDVVIGDAGVRVERLGKSYRSPSGRIRDLTRAEYRSHEPIVGPLTYAQLTALRNAAESAIVTVTGDWVGLAQVITVGAAGAAIGAVAVPVGSLAYNIPAGTVLTFTGGKLATLSARALRGAVSLAVNPLAAALAAGNTATHTPSMRAHVEIDDENPVPNGAGGFLYLATLTVREAGAGQ